MRYVAFGLQLRSPFALPGMLERSDDSLPWLDLEIATCASIHSTWENRETRVIWQGALGDGSTIQVRRSSSGEHLFVYDDRALFALDQDGERLACAPSEDGIAWQRVLLTKVIANVALIRGYEALHASAVESPEGAVVVLASSGTGKTALALALANAGWPLLSDDIVVFGRRSGGVHAHPGTPHLNADHQTVASQATRRLALVLGVVGNELWLAARLSTLAPCPVRAICLLERAPFLSLQVAPMPRSPVALMPYMLGLEDHGERARWRFELYSELMADASLIRVSAGERHPPHLIAEHLRSVLEAQPGQAVAVLS